MVLKDEISKCPVKGCIGELKFYLYETDRGNTTSRYECTACKTVFIPIWTPTEGEE